MILAQPNALDTVSVLLIGLSPLVVMFAAPFYLGFAFLEFIFVCSPRHALRSIGMAFGMAATLINIAVLLLSFEIGGRQTAEFLMGQPFIAILFVLPILLTLIEVVIVLVRWLKPGPPPVVSYERLLSDSPSSAPR